jgi:hypothetical protein
MLETIEGQAGPKIFHDMFERRPVEPAGDGQPLDGRLQRQTIFPQHPRDDLAPASLEGWRRDLEAIRHQRFVLRHQCPPVLDRKIEHERINRRARPRLLLRAVDDGLPNLRGLDGDRAQEVVCVLRGQPAKKMLCALQVIAPIWIISPWQALAREDDCEKPIGVRDQRTDMAIERILFPARAGAGLIEHALVFVDEENETVLRMRREMMVQVLRQHPRQQRRQLVTLLQLAGVVEFLQLVTRPFEIGAFGLVDEPAADVWHQSHAWNFACYFADYFTCRLAKQPTLEFQRRLAQRYVGGRRGSSEPRIGEFWKGLLAACCFPGYGQRQIEGRQVHARLGKAISDPYQQQIGFVRLAAMKIEFRPPHKCVARVDRGLAPKFATEGGFALSAYAVENPDDGTAGRNREGRVFKDSLRRLAVDEDLVGGGESVGAKRGHPGT